MAQIKHVKEVLNLASPLASTSSVPTTNALGFQTEPFHDLEPEGRHQPLGGLILLGYKCLVPNPYSSPPAP